MPDPTAADATESAVQEHVQEQVGCLLARKLTPRAIACRPGRELYVAKTRFQLGWQLRGVRTGEPGA
ncbi:hypothetical protein F7Q99_13505 [Streptomyces kaniharaensis]|uniref:Uncharacterized protein n=1 Tax=Streptomyces kaniharaensis TaxID=212423 RepID=A0A6N7KPB9_9ACTN|nr:hypothetical protein [Streptomyces kaniharaensis]MQS13271.1 hypothetical protein [Streptomyces kaniharaensis]